MGIAPPEFVAALEGVYGPLTSLSDGDAFVLVDEAGEVVAQIETKSGVWMPVAQVVLHEGAVWEWDGEGFVLVVELHNGFHVDDEGRVFEWDGEGLVEVELPESVEEVFEEVVVTVEDGLVVAQGEYLRMEYSDGQWRIPAQTIRMVASEEVLANAASFKGNYYAEFDKTKEGLARVNLASDRMIGMELVFDDNGSMKVQVAMMRKYGNSLHVYKLEPELFSFQGEGIMQQWHIAGERIEIDDLGVLIRFADTVLGGDNHSGKVHAFAPLEGVDVNDACSQSGWVGALDFLKTVCIDYYDSSSGEDMPSNGQELLTELRVAVKDFPGMEEVVDWDHFFSDEVPHLDIGKFIFLFILLR